MLIAYKQISLSIVAVALLLLAGCGSGSRPMNSGNFSGTVAVPNAAATVTPAGRTAVANVALSRAHIVGGTSAIITVNLTQPAPAEGIAVQLSSSDASIVAAPAVVKISPGQISATVVAATIPVSADTTVAIGALYQGSIAGTSLSIASAPKYPFSVAINPSTVTLSAGQSGSIIVATKIIAGYDQALSLAVLSLPTGVAVTLTPPVIPAPGAGTSVADITVSNSLAPGSYSIEVTASHGRTVRSAKLKLNVASSSGPGATFQGCWYKQNGKRYQAVTVSVTNSGTYPFNAILYNGTTCNPNDWADQFGFGQPLQFSSGFDWTFWFTDFAGQSDTSAFWYVGNSQSQCVNYAVAPDC